MCVQLVPRQVRNFSLYTPQDKFYRIYHWSLMQTEKSIPEGKRIMPETRFTLFPAFSVDLRVGISRSASETGD